MTEFDCEDVHYGEPCARDPHDCDIAQQEILDAEESRRSMEEEG